MLVGRESERRTISTLLAGARVADSRVLVLSGEPGIGKSALLADAEAEAQDMRVLWARGVESEQYVPFAGLLQLLRPLLPLLEHIPGPQSAALSSALLLSGSQAGTPSRFAVGAATLSLLARAAEDSPLAVLVDDAHLLDTPSAEALVFAARRLVSDPVAMVVAVRADEPGAEAWAALPALAVTGLEISASEELLRTAFGDVPADRLVRLHQATAGNPLGLLELGDRFEDARAAPRESATAVSDRITRSFVGRARDLDDDARSALLVAAADSASLATVHQACAALGVDAGALVRAEDAGLVALRGDAVEFRHPLVRSAVYGAAEPELRRKVHRALADAVPRGEAARLAWHLSRGAVAPDEQTAATLDVVATDASHRGAHAIAARAHERAAALTAAPIRLAPRLAAAAEASWLAGLTNRAVELLDRALAAHPDPHLRAHIHELRGAVETRGGSLETAHSLLVRAAEEIENLDPDRAVRMYADAVHVCFYLARADAAMQAARAIERLLETASNPDARYLGSVAAGMALVLTGEGVRGIEKMRGASYQLVVGEDEPEDVFRLPLRLQGALWLRDSAAHRAVVTDAIDRMRDQAALGSLPYMLMHIARDAATTDRWGDAETAYVESIRLARETGQSTDLAASLAGLAILNARRGQEQECRENSAAAAPLCRSHGIRLGDFWLEFAQGDLLAGQGDLAGAARHYESLLDGLSQSGLSDPDQSCAPELVETYVHLGRMEEARAITTEFAASAEAKGQPWSLARAERARALCSPRDDQSAGPGEHFTRALELHAKTSDHYEKARTELAYGAWLRRDRQRVAARPLLGSALSAFEQLGATPWADKAAQELAATGETVRRREVNAMDELTPQERQIAQLLAQGRTTREAAAALFISPKTVEYHLRHVYLKLGIRSREALTETFAR